MYIVDCMKDFSLSELWVSSHDKLSDFYLSAWQRGESPVPLLVVRLTLAAVASGILIWSLVAGAGPYWIIYLTNWGLLLVTMMTLSGLLVSCMSLCKPLTDAVELPWYVSMYWLIYNITVSIAIMITLLYWILLFDPDETNDGSAQGDIWLDVATHGINSCITLVEVLAARTPVRLLHVYQPLGVGLWYAAFSGVYYAAGGTDGNGYPFIYEILDWRQGGRAGTVVAASTACLIVIYVLVWGTTLCREKLSLATIRTTSHSLPLTPPDPHTHIV
ncbi:PREDICTED: protein rolling stone-like isoform X2 [Papilio polytes]|uniref:protein rolling stone-like isoform X2 n=1 Tax=Papilio polytes TaxID=76194 RepID=UPI00067657A0|nr:PREDICTED: protein rolling stone-like isoform X2 [Papilio polytes]